MSTVSLPSDKVAGKHKAIDTPQLHAVQHPGSLAYEPRRDWSIGFITGHRTRIIVCMTLITLALFAYQDWLWPNGRRPDNTWQEVWSWGSFLWITATIPGTLGLFGMLYYRHPTTLDDLPKINNLVSFRIVSRGQNIDALRSTILRCRTEMAKTPVFEYLIEVVVEQGTELHKLPTGDDIVYLVIPDAYATPNGSLYKARALQFALEHSTVSDDTWLVHLDEETQPTASGIKGICKLIFEEEASGQLRVGQGAILYHRDWKKHPILTMADNVRTGDDFARFHFQHRLGVTVFGLHGSYIVARNDVESAIGFDFGPVGSITEDAFWALVLMESGGRARWCEGYLEEQSTQSFSDFVKQRRRWFQGLMKVSLFAPVKLLWRLCLGTNTLLWTFAPFAAIYTIIHFFYGFEVRGWIRWTANLAFAEFMTLYLTGLKANMDEHPKRGWFCRTGWTLAQIVLTPLFSFMESAGVLLAIVKPVSGFHVIKK